MASGPRRKAGRANRSSGDRPAGPAYRAALAAGAAAAAAYAGTAGHTFVYDDIEGVLNNPLVRGFGSLAQAGSFLRETWRPLTQLSYALTHYFFGFEAWAYHLGNVLIHAADSALVCLIADRAGRLWLPADKRRNFALAAGLIFALHPLQSEAVAYVWGRSSSLCALFYFGSLLLVMLGSRAESVRRRLACYGGALLAGFLAWASKEEAITLPLLVAGYFLLVGCRKAAAVAAPIPVLLVAARWGAIGKLYAEVGENRFLVSAGAEPALPPWTYFLTHVREFVFYYLRRYVWPFGLNADPATRPAGGITDPAFLAAALVFVALAAWALWALRRERAVTFGLAALLISPLTAYGLMPLADVVAEHRAYISTLGFAMVAAWALVRRPRRTGVLLPAVALVLGAVAWQRSRAWRDGLTLWSDTARKSPGLARPHLNLGMALQSAGRADEALAEYGRALEINAGLAPAYVNMSAIYFDKGDIAGCRAALERAAALSPRLAAPYINLGILSLRQGRPAEALEFLDRASAIEESHIVRFNRGEAFFQLGRSAEAAREYERALELRPDLEEMKEQIRLRLEQLRKAGAVR
jgi:tetratricopeptide (TPR) repeat protein